jgi:hypothetical protein
MKPTPLCRHLLLILILALLFAPGTLQADAGEEFVGPFPSWRDLRRDYGAVGDGKADDTDALQKALTDLIKHEKACVLHIPAGTYRITRTVKTTRKAHTDCMGVTVVGADPATTTILWDGPEGGTMIGWDAWYSKISRLTLDGHRKAAICLLYGPAFSTYNETSDIVFRDARSGLVFGGPGTNGQAENEVLRCRFLRCDTGIQTVNWNSMDVWVWHSRFEDCGRGIHNVMGNWHAWHCLFLRSRTADVSILNLMAFSVVGNTSVGSRCFLDFSTGHTWGSPVSMTGNRVLDPTGEWAAILDNAGPYLVVDNVFRLRGKARGVRMTWGDQTLAGNTYTREDAVAERGRFRRLAERVVAAGDIPDAIPDLPATPPLTTRKVFEVAADATAAEIQRAIDSAARESGKRPVVHLPMAAYRIDKTLVIPAGSDLQLIGDGGAETATRLNWAGPAGGVVLRLQGPSQAVVRDCYLHAPGAQALRVEGADQPGGRIFADQLNASGPTAVGKASAAVKVSRIDQTDVLFRALQGSGNAAAWVEVIGGPRAAEAKNQVSIFTGATGSAAGQYAVRGGARLVVRGVYHERSSDSLNGLHLSGSGVLSIDATRFSYATSEKAPTVAVEDFHGLFTLATCILMPVETKETCRFEFRGDGSAASVLALNNQFWIEQPTTTEQVWRNKARPPAHGGLVGCNVNTSNKKAAAKGWAFLPNIGDAADPARAKYGSGPLDDQGTVDDATLLRHLAPLRSARVWVPGGASAGTTNIQLHRVMASGEHGATVEFRGKE